MSLNVYTDKKYIPEGMELVIRCGLYFNANMIVKPDEFTLKLFKYVQRAEYIDDRMFKCDNGYDLPMWELAGGVKAALNVHNFPDKCFLGVTVGTNVIEYLLDLHEGNVLFDIPLFILDGECDVLVNNDKYFSSREELRNYLSYAD